MNISELHKTDPYEGYDLRAWLSKLEGWNSYDPIFLELIQKHRPQFIIEVGTWLGASAIHMARCQAECGIAGQVLCVDTWLGSVEFWTNQDDPTRYGSLNLNHGYPTVYYQFLANVLHAGCREYIIPFPQTSANAARWLALKRVQADLVYLDASHEYGDVMADLDLYWPLVKPGGVMLGDDWLTFLDVPRAVKDFSDRRGIQGLSEGNKWWIRKGND